MTAKDYIAAIEREVEEWPNVLVSFDLGVHNRAIFTWRGRSRFMMFPGSPSDQRGLRNGIGEMRRLLTALGAERVKREPSPHRDRARNKPYRPPSARCAPVMPNPFDALRETANG